MDGCQSCSGGLSVGTGLAPKLPRKKGSVSSQNDFWVVAPSKLDPLRVEPIWCSTGVPGSSSSLNQSGRSSRVGHLRCARRRPQPITACMRGRVFGHFDTNRPSTGQEPGCREKEASRPLEQLELEAGRRPTRARLSAQAPGPLRHFRRPGPGPASPASPAMPAMLR